MADDIYNGYFIPKGSVVVANSWYVFRRMLQLQRR